MRGTCFTREVGSQQHVAARLPERGTARFQSRSQAARQQVVVQATATADRQTVPQSAQRAEPLTVPVERAPEAERSALMIGYPTNFEQLYELGQPLGRGSFKTVFVGRHRQTGQRVAVQIISKQREGTSQEHNISRIKREVSITKRLQVRSEVIRLHGVFEDAKNVYFITEMCDGGTLESYMRHHGRMPEADAAMLVMDVLHVLAECNAQRICYADVKPANILLKDRYPDVRSSKGDCQEAPPNVRIIDFGCSQYVEDGSKLAKRTGTPLFLPPEMFMRHWGPEADLWSLGMVTYLLLSGKMPFWGGAMGGIPPFMVMQEILGGDIRFDGPEWEGISEDAIDFVDRLLDRDFNSRMTAEQALQHAWMVLAMSSGDDLQECSLDWDDSGDYNVMRSRTQSGKHYGHSGQQMCTVTLDDA